MNTSIEITAMNKLSKKISKKNLIFLCIGLCLSSFIIPFLTRSDEDANSTVLSLAFTAVSTVAAIVALIIAISLYDRFGLEIKFVERRADKVLELVDLIKGQILTVSFQNKSHRYRINFDKNNLLALDHIPLYSKDRCDNVLISGSNFFKEISDLKRSYWLPDEIKKSLSFFEVFAYMEEEDDISNHALISINDGKSEKLWCAPISEITLEGFILAMYKLSSEIEAWLKKHCEINIDLNLAEENQHPRIINDKD